MRLTLLWRYFVGRGGLLFQASTFFSILGVALGVFCLVLAMSSFSGFESTLMRAITDSQGHVMILSRGMPMENPEAVESKIWASHSEVEALMPYAILEGMVAHRERVGFVMLTGVPWPGFEKVLSLNQRLMDGSLASPGSETDAIVGEGVAQRFALQVGDSFPFIWPRASGAERARFSPVLKRLTVVAIVDFGKHDLNERTVITQQETVQNLGLMGDRVSGFYVQLTDAELAPRAAAEIAVALGSNFWVSDWRAQNRNLFSAIDLEKMVIFFVLMIMVIAAGVNVSLNLSTTVLKKYSDIALLKTLGFTSRGVQQIFIGYGTLVCAFGIGLGLLMGAGGTVVLEWVQTQWQILPGDVYKLDSIELDIRLLDIVLISGAALFIGVLSTWLPARKGARLQPVEGLRYE